jgi:hypothetical protein
VACPGTWAECDGRFTVNQGTLGGGGQVNGDLTNAGGTLSPGSGVGSFSVLGNYCQLPAAEMVFEIGGLRQRVDHDFLWVNGTAELSGGFRIELVNDFTPSPGDEFVLMNLLRVEGKFDTMTVPDLGASAAWDFSNLLDAGVARVVPEPASGSMKWFFLLGLGFLAKRRRSS